MKRNKKSKDSVRSFAHKQASCKSASLSSTGSPLRHSSVAYRPTGSASVSQLCHNHKGCHSRSKLWRCCLICSSPDLKWQLTAPLTEDRRPAPRSSLSPDGMIGQSNQYKKYIVFSIFCVAIAENTCRWLACENAWKLVHFRRSRCCFPRLIDAKIVRNQQNRTKCIEKIYTPV